MSSSESREKADRETTHLILYDGLCGLCNRLNLFVLRRDGAGAFKFASLQSELGQSLLRSFGRDPGRLETVCVVADYGAPSARLLRKSSAALFISERLGLWRLAAAVLRIFPHRLLDWAYDVVARNRYRIFGRYEICPTPSPEHRSRFIDDLPGS